MMPRGMFGCMACCAAMAILFFSLALAFPYWSGFFVNDRKCQRDDGCGVAKTVKKGEDIPESGLKFTANGVFSVTNGITPNGIDWYKKNRYPDADKLADAKKACNERPFAKPLDITCTWRDEDYSCTCGMPSTGKWDPYVDKNFAKFYPKDYCKSAPEKVKEHVNEDADVLDILKVAAKNAIVTQYTLIAACCLHFIGLLLGVAGAVTVLPIVGIVAAICNTIAFALGLTGAVLGMIYGHLELTYGQCGSIEWYKEANTQIPDPEGQIYPMGLSGILAIVGMVFSVLAACTSCASAFTAKQAREQSRPESAYNKF